MEENNIMKLIRKSCRLLCHQKPERCFKIKGYIFPICARCTGISISFTIVLILLFFKIYINIYIAFLLFLVMFIDWFIQFLKIKESTNTRRFITGVIGGFGTSYLYYYIIRFLMSYFFIKNFKG